MADRFKLSVKNLSKAFVTKKDDTLVIDDISMDVRENEFLVILGPGQCGKTVLLNMVAGLLKPTLGEIYMDGEKVSGLDKRVRMVFQKLALLPWLTVSKNVQIGMKYAKVPKEQRERVAQHYIDLVGLQGFERSYPHQLSGGMKQRVGIARAYASAPEVLLMDEPYGQMDIKTRFYLEDEVVRIWKELHSTVLFITHNIEEAVYLADRILILSQKPASVKEDVVVDLPRPRDINSPEFVRLRSYVTDQIKWW